MSADPAHTPCVLTTACGPHCGLDRGYLGHCTPCHAGSPLGEDGMHGAIPPWRKLLASMLGSVPPWMCLQPPVR